MNLQKLNKFINSNFIIICVSLLLVSPQAFSNQYIVKKKSSYSVKETLDRFEKFASKKGLTIFTRIDHQKNASNAKLNMKKEQVIIFGNPKMGTKLMLENPLMGIELPLKVMAYKDDRQQVWLSYVNPDFYKDFYSIKNELILTKMTTALKCLTDKSTK